MLRPNSSRQPDSYPGTHPIQVSAPRMLPRLYFYLPRASLRTWDFIYRFQHICFYMCVTVDPFIYDSACISVSCASITILEMQQKNLSWFFFFCRSALPTFPPPFMMHSLRHWSLCGWKIPVWISIRDELPEWISRGKLREKGIGTVLKRFVLFFPKFSLPICSNHLGFLFLRTAEICTWTLIK